MKRLTKRLPTGTAIASENWIPVPYEATCQELAQRLADYEDEEEQGRLLHLPCKIGDKIYQIEAHGCNRPVSECAFPEIYDCADCKFCRFSIREKDFVLYYLDKSTGKLLDLFFLNKEEAETKLKELEEGNVD